MTREGKREMILAILKAVMMLVLALLIYDALVRTMNGEPK